MSTIDVHRGAVRAANARLTGIRRNVGSARDSIRRAQSSIDRRVFGRFSLHSRMQAVDSEIDAIENQLQNIQKTVEDILNRYENMDRDLARQIESRNILAFEPGTQARSTAFGVAGSANLIANSNKFNEASINAANRALNAFRGNNVVAQNRRSVRSRISSFGSSALGKVRIVGSGALNVKRDVGSSAFGKVRTVGSGALSVGRNVRSSAASFLSTRDLRQDARNVSNITFGILAVKSAVGISGATFGKGTVIAAPIAFWGGAQIGDGIRGLATGTEQNSMKEILTHYLPDGAGTASYVAGNYGPCFTSKYDLAKCGVKIIVDEALRERPILTGAKRATVAGTSWFIDFITRGK